MVCLENETVEHAEQLYCLGNRSLGRGQEISAGKSRDLGAGVGPAINQLGEPLLCKSGRVGSDVIQHDFWL